MEPQNRTRAPASSDVGSAGSHGAQTPAERVDALRPGMAGRWEVHTRGSRHVWDLDAHTYARHPRNPQSGMPHDGTGHAITGVAAWPRVGGHSYVLFDDQDNPGLEHWRRSGTILTITRARA